MMEAIINTAGIREIFRYRDLVRNLVAKEIKVRYMGTIIGFAWSLMNPLVITAMYLVVFTYIFKPVQHNFALYLITGIIHWTFFSNVASQSSEILVMNAGLIKKIYFPRILIPFSSLLVNLAIWLMALAIFCAFIPLLGGQFTMSMLVYPFYLLLLIIFSFGLSLILTTLYVDFRDIKHLVDVFLQVLFWASPILYPLGLVPVAFRSFMLATPLVEFTEIFHVIFYQNSVPSLNLTLAFSAWTVVSISLGLWLFNRRVPLLLERL